MRSVVLIAGVLASAFIVPAAAGAGAQLLEAQNAILGRGPLGSLGAIATFGQPPAATIRATVIVTVRLR
jgi:hypothetical protein